MTILFKEGKEYKIDLTIKVDNNYFARKTMPFNLSKINKKIKER